MTFSGSTKNKTIKSKNGENVPHLEISEEILVHCYIVNNNHQMLIIGYFTQKSIFFKTFNSGFSYIEVWFTHQNSKMLETEDKRNITSVTN